MKVGKDSQMYLILFWTVLMSVGVLKAQNDFHIELPPQIEREITTLTEESPAYRFIIKTLGHQKVIVCLGVPNGDLCAYRTIDLEDLDGEGEFEFHPDDFDAKNVGITFRNYGIFPVFVEYSIEKIEDDLGEGGGGSPNLNCGNGSQQLPDWTSEMNKLYACPAAKVGINTSQPKFTLDVNGAVKVNKIGIGTAPVGNKAIVSSGEVQMKDGSFSVLVEENQLQISDPSKPVSFDLLSQSLGYSSQIRFRDNNGAVRHTIVDERTNDRLLIVPGYSQNVSSEVEVAGGILVRDKLAVGNQNPQYAVDVSGTVRACEMIVESYWCDFVFEQDYDLMPLEKVAEFIQEKKHLPGIPSALEVESEGQRIGEIQRLHFQKTEELFLYILELEERISELETQLNQ